MPIYDHAASNGLMPFVIAGAMLACLGVSYALGYYHGRHLKLRRLKPLPPMIDSD